jgi:hypothetical protein
MPQRRRYANQVELRRQVIGAAQWQPGVQIDTTLAVDGVLDALVLLGVDLDALVKITVDEPEP